MNTQGKGANFSPYKEESNARKNTQNYCRGPAHDRDADQRWRSQQQIKTIFARSSMLRLAAAAMPRQSSLSRNKKVASAKRVL
jgi:hypothetical protein